VFFVKNEKIFSIGRKKLYFKESARPESRFCRPRALTPARESGIIFP